ncbi:RNA-protein complex protein Nop10 [Methanimicrococcus blatticola]|uniref:Ribosome biogenesis protein Nop10 n=1 Tax=Methanimicrococcus blatticola TaxID=91560 RepID=A0A484F5V8_9EURY|nr:RNA-protein complex protein Nop10 [Methanimicrococcus blatticola]MBZ3935260.1 RNA-protein complex protein Nop10 [Methanimicrococcus blatticola]MCC2508642.1 RNA-protein complex protein Nop10 [Methanimicrococcus blatticola]TDQ67948.1 rRNA maturation protein Nop10 [Methanimicrococcus blatticola]
MGKRIKKCQSCSRYTLSETCPDCGGVCVSPKPASYSPEDRYGKYRRMYRQSLNDSRKE